MDNALVYDYLNCMGLEGRHLRRAAAVGATLLEVMACGGRPTPVFPDVGGSVSLGRGIIVNALAADGTVSGTCFAQQGGTITVQQILDGGMLRVLYSSPESTVPAGDCQSGTVFDVKRYQ